MRTAKKACEDEGFVDKFVLERELWRN